MKKKVRKDKVKRSLDKERKEVRMGAPPSSERNLDENQKKFAVMIGRGVPIEVAQKSCGFTDYQRRKYLDPEEWPQIQTEIKRWVDVFGQEDAERIKSLNDKLIDAVYADMIKQAENGKLSESVKMKLIERELQRVALIDGSPTMESTKITEKIKKTITGRQLEQIPFTEDDDLKEEEERERSIETKTEEKGD